MMPAVKIMSIDLTRIGDNMRICKACNIEKPLSEYNKTGRKQTYLRVCKACKKLKVSYVNKKPCLICGTEFVTKHNYKKYCSAKCQRQGRSLRKLEINPKFDISKSDKRYTQRQMIDLRNEIKKHNNRHKEYLIQASFNTEIIKSYLYELGVKNDNAEM